MKKISIIMLAALLAGCLSPVAEGYYHMFVIDQNGEPVKSQNINVHTDSENYNMARKTACLIRPGALIRVINEATGEDVEGQSPFRCP